MKTPYAKQSAFTIVELLIVIVVIGILATIAVVAYNGIHNRAYDTTVRSDLANASRQLEIIKVSLDRYPRAASEFPATFKCVYDDGEQSILLRQPYYG